MKRLGILLGALLLATGLVLAFEEMIWFEVWEVGISDGTVTYVSSGIQPEECPDGCTTLECCGSVHNDCLDTCVDAHCYGHASLCEAGDPHGCFGACWDMTTQCNAIVSEGGCCVVAIGE